MSNKEQQVSLLILEDDESSLSMLCDTVKKHFPQLGIYPAKDISSAETHFQQHVPQLLLLDINLPDGDAFSLLKHLRDKEHEDFQVIFVTGQGDYALQAIKHSALDFLLKPFRNEELVEAIEKALRQIHDLHYRKQLETFLHNISYGKEEARIVLKTAEETHVISVADIIQVEADNNYCRFFIGNAPAILISRPLKTFERKLDFSGFVRVHQSHLVNLRHIKSFNRKKLFLKMTDGTEIPVSMGKKNEVQSHLDRLTSY
ncbi:LytR/AlgR family response regulator transcription factor [Olivibacter sitiensis]|uniref:LytR/AlgR family response regulator transcription factor n=1 Tax=Olivibacter sitiensis TaxID=376470 RepID=UPI000404EB7F|nr:LytTR family DNA-binding domain-containing protein [Olivibacter sitiensis]